MLNYHDSSIEDVVEGGSQKSFYLVMCSTLRSRILWCSEADCNRRWWSGHRIGH